MMIPINPTSRIPAMITKAILTKRVNPNMLIAKKAILSFWMAILTDILKVPTGMKRDRRSEISEARILLRLLLVRLRKIW